MDTYPRMSADDERARCESGGSSRARVSEFLKNCFFRHDSNFVFQNASLASEAACPSDVAPTVRGQRRHAMLLSAHAETAIVVCKVGGLREQ
jgi:hypothetical protein